MTTEELLKRAQQLADRLAAREATLVLAESCTGGLIAATLTTVPGISKWLCGSAVVYQVETKAEWLGIPPSLLDDPGPVSPEVTEAMARRALERTPHAQIAASVTGHLGPGVAADVDGLMYAAVVFRSDHAESPDFICEHRLQSAEQGGTTGPADSLRIRRQRQAAAFVLSLLCTVFETGTDGHSVAT